jgi:hypothetical protein
VIFDPEAIGDGAGVLIEAGLESGHPPAEILSGGMTVMMLMSMNYGFFVLLCAQLLEEVESRIFSYAAASTLWRRRSNPARPYMDRLMAFNRLICPSTGPVLQGSVKAACTASRS